MYIMFLFIVLKYLIRMCIILFKEYLKFFLSLFKWLEVFVDIILILFFRVECNIVWNNNW